MLSQTYSHPSIPPCAPSADGFETSKRTDAQREPAQEAQTERWGTLAAAATVALGGWATWMLANTLLSAWQYY